MIIIFGPQAETHVAAHWWSGVSRVEEEMHSSSIMICTGSKRAALEQWVAGIRRGFHTWESFILVKNKHCAQVQEPKSQMSESVKI